MFSLDAIPEPTNNAPSTEPVDAPAHHQLIATTPAEVNPQTNANDKSASSNQDADTHVDSIAVLLVLLIAGALLRIVLGLLGPLQGITPAAIEQTQQHGKQTLSGETQTAYPLFDLLALGVGATGLPAWSVVLIGSALTFAAIPAAFFIGQTLTDRRAAGIAAAAIVAVHPAVLTAANSYNSAAIALGLITLGLATLCFVERKGALVAFMSGIALGLAGLAAPLCWLVGALAGPITYKLARRRGVANALGLALMVMLLATTPALSYRAVFFGHDTNALFPEWSSTNLTEQTPTPLNRLLVTMTHPSFNELGEAMHLPLGDAGRLKVTGTAAPAKAGNRDVVADTLADGWLILNAALAGLAAISIGVMLARRRMAEAFLLVIPITAMAFTTLEPGEAIRLPMIALVGVLATSLFATKSIPYIDEEAKEAKRLAKLAKREAKEQARQERELAKHKESLYAFDQPTRPKPPRQTAQATPSHPEQADTTAHPAPQDEAPAVSARPI